MKLELIREGNGREKSCVYLPGRLATTRYRCVDNCSAQTYARMLERGWRRFGRVFFRPACAGCGDCVSLRVDVERFRPSRSMRRNLRRNRDLEVRLRPASMTAEQLALYDRYHAEMARRKGWRQKEADPLDYFHSFVDGRQDFGHELLYLLGDRLLAVALVDLLPAAVSAVYCFYEPGERRRGLGVFSILQHVALARSRGIPHVYLGYWVGGNPSMCYKARYRPHQLLRGRPASDERPDWVAADGRGNRFVRRAATRARQLGDRHPNERPARGPA